MDAGTFKQHATANIAGLQYMSKDDFIDAIAPNIQSQGKINPSQYGILFDVADRRHAGSLSLQDWLAFADLLAKPDAEYEIAFRVFDRNNSGRVNYAALQHGAPSASTSTKPDLDYPQFAQLVKDLQGEHVRNAFRGLDSRRDINGYVSTHDLQSAVAHSARHQLSDHVLDHLQSLADEGAPEKISIARLRAFENVVSQLDLIEHVVRVAVSGSADGRVNRDEFMNAAARSTRSALFTPLEVDVLFHFASLDNTSNDTSTNAQSTSSPRLALPDFLRVVDPMYTARPTTSTSALEKSKSIVKEEAQSFVHTALETLHHFGLGSLAGAFGAFMVYPIDLVKTRMQNQRSVRVGAAPLYANSIDCAKKVISHEGPRGLYSGVLPQLVGVAPEKAIKLTVNDISREFLTNKSTGVLWTPLEPLAGASAGACQVIFTNPLEIVKIRLQMQGEALKADPSVPRRSAVWIVRHLGLKGLYKGASACLLRDIPFSSIYFPTYAHLKTSVFQETPSKPLGVFQLLTAGALAGMPAAYLTTPCDVIKTRLQSETRQGETKYTSLRHCIRTIARDEGARAFFKGGPARVLRSSPQFGFTLAAYEMLQKLIPMPGTAAATTAAAVGAVDTTGGIGGVGGGKEAQMPLPFLRSRKAMRLLLDLDQNTGIFRIAQAKTPTKTQAPSASTSTSTSEEPR